MSFLKSPLFLKVLTAVGLGATAFAHALSGGNMDATTVAQLGAALSTIAALFHAAPGSK
jgi:hypothetical protein